MSLAIRPLEVKKLEFIIFTKTENYICIFIKDFETDGDLELASIEIVIISLGSLSPELD